MTGGPAGAPNYPRASDHPRDAITGGGGPRRLNCRAPGCGAPPLFRGRRYKGGGGGGGRQSPPVRAPLKKQAHTPCLRSEMGLVRRPAVLLVIAMAVAVTTEGHAEDYEPPELLTREIRNRLERRMPTIVRVGKRFDDVEDDSEPPKLLTREIRNRLERRMPTIVRVGKRFDEVEDDSEIKRNPKFMAFLRVGRTGYKTFKIDLNDGIEKRNDPKTGMWFGPRLGRTLSERKADFGDNLPWAYIVFSENPLQQFARSGTEPSESALSASNIEPRVAPYVETA